MLLIEISETEPVTGKLLIRGGFLFLFISTEDPIYGLGVVDIAFLKVDHPVKITVKPQAAASVT